MTNAARFTINGTPSEDGNGDRGFEATASQTLTITLEENPSQALAVRYSVYDSTDPESPLSSKDAPLLTFTGSSASSQTLTAVNDSVELIMPSSGVHSWLVRCVATTANGADSFERLVAIKTATSPAIRKTIPGETQYFEARGWSDPLNEMVEYIRAFGGGGGALTIVDSVVDLRLLDLGVGRVNEVVSLRYHTNLGDGGDGFFRFVNDATLSDDDGIFIASARPNYFFVRLYGNGPISVLHYGAQGDWNGSSGTDDAAAFQNALDALANPKIPTTDLYIPAGRYRIGSTLQLPSYNDGADRHVPNVRITGDGYNDYEEDYGTWIYADMSSGHLLSDSDAPLDRTRYLTIERVTFAQTPVNGATADDIISLDAGATFLNMDKITFLLRNPAARFLYVYNAPGRVTLENIRGYMATGASVPAVELSVIQDSLPRSNLFGIVIRDTMIDANSTTTAPIFRLIGDSVSTLYCSNVILEYPKGGGIETYSFRRAVYNNVFSADLLTTPTNPTIYIRKWNDSQGDGTTPQDHTFIGCTLSGATDAVPDIKVEPGIGHGGPNIIGCRVGFIDSQTPPVIIGSVNIGISTAGGDPTRLASAFLLGVEGISRTQTTHRNLRHRITVYDGDTSNVQNLPSPEPDTNYYIIATPVSSTGSPAVGSNRIVKIDKTATQITLHVEAAPGVGSSVSFDYTVWR